MGLVMLGRAAFVFPLSFLINLSKKNQSEKIDIKQQVVIWWAGLMRGAVSMALAYNKFTRSGHTELCGNAIMITSTITVCLFSTMVFGMLTKPLIRYLRPHQNLTTSMLSDDNTPKSINFPLLYGEQQDSFVELSGNRHNQTAFAVSSCAPHALSTITGDGLMMPSCVLCLVVAVLFPLCLVFQLREAPMISVNH